MRFSWRRALSGSSQASNSLRPLPAPDTVRRVDTAVERSSSELELPAERDPTFIFRGACQMIS